MNFKCSKLKRVERAVVDSLKAGTVYGPEDADPCTWPVVQASFIRDLICGVGPGLVSDPHGLRLRHVHVDGRLDLDRVETRIALELEECDLPGGLTAAHARLAALSLRRLTIERASGDEAVLHLENLHVEQLNVTGTTLTNPAGSALYADGLTVEADACFDGLAATGHGPEGSVRLVGASITGQLQLRGAQLTNDNGPALQADGLTVQADAYLDKGFIATGHNADGAVRLVGALITGPLILRGATLSNKAGPALNADRLTIKSTVYLNTLTATGHGITPRGITGAVRLVGASIAGQLFLRGARLSNEAGPALYADRLTVGADVLLDEGFTATGHGDRGAVHLPGARIAGHLLLRGAELTNNTGPALYAVRLTTGHGIVLEPTIRPPRPRKEQPSPRWKFWSLRKRKTEARPVAVNLFGVDAGTVLDISSATLDAAMEAGEWNITGLTYRTLTSRTEEKWLDFLREGTVRYSPQPYRQFATVTGLAGDERLTRKAHIAQRDDQLARSWNEKDLLSFWGRVRAWVLRVTVGYGYHSWRALLWLLGVIAAAAALTFTMGSGENLALATTAASTAGNPLAPCRDLDLWIRTLETIPLVPLAPGAKANCVYADTPQAGVYLGLITILKVMAWALLTLFIAGYTNLVRKTGP